MHVLQGAVQSWQTACELGNFVIGHDSVQVETSSKRLLAQLVQNVDDDWQVLHGCVQERHLLVIESEKSGEGQSDRQVDFSRKKE